MKAFLVINCLAVLLVQVVHGFAPVSLTGSKAKTSATSTELQVWAEPYGGHGYGRRRYSAYYRPTRDDGVDGAGRLDMGANHYTRDRYGGRYGGRMSQDFGGYNGFHRGGSYYGRGGYRDPYYSYGSRYGRDMDYFGGGYGYGGGYYGARGGRYYGGGYGGTYRDGSFYDRDFYPGGRTDYYSGRKMSNREMMDRYDRRGGRFSYGGGRRGGYDWFW
ncbi:predicted protein [Chaetoceros tenuissimus]|uniref:Uncharacterized protein n=1 Tax=Chaetoceros tenuissimus TaxID=426638 RepID=A0AAD3HBW4_9STRA|nr:predicted protein [Chaetoceros tenuissimus]